MFWPVSNYHSLEKHLLSSAWFLFWGEKRLLAAALFMSDGYTVYILKHLECEQLPLLLSHQVSYTLYKLLFYYQRNVSLSLLIPACLALPSLFPKHHPPAASPTCLLSTIPGSGSPTARAEWSLPTRKEPVRSTEHRLFLEPLTPKC